MGALLVRQPMWERLSKAARQLGLFQEAKHPRYPKGHPKGGRFMLTGRRVEGGEAPTAAVTEVGKEERPTPSKPERKQWDPDKPWEYPASVYQSLVLRVKQPWIGEISSTQYLRMSKRGKAAYERKHSEEWQASSDAKDEWRGLVIAAYEAGIINADTPGISEDAENAIWHHERQKKEQAEEARKTEVHEAVQIASSAELTPGDKVYSVMLGPVTVVRVNRKSVRVKTEKYGDALVPWSEGPPYPFAWKSHRDVEAEFEKAVLSFGGPRA